MESAGFLLRKWCSNDKHVMKMIYAAELAANPNAQNEPERPLSHVVSVLGLKWNTESDEIIFA